MSPIKHFLLRVLALGLLLLLAISLWMTIYFIRPLPFSTPSITLSIPAGASVRQIANTLTTHGVLSEPYSFLLAVKLTASERALKAGDYVLNAPLQVSGLMDMLKHGTFDQRRFQIVEGKTFADMRQKMAQIPWIHHETIGWSEAEIMQKITGSPQPAEGWFFPDTYFIDAQTSDLAIYQRAYQKMQAHLARAWQQRAADLPYTHAYQALIMASIVEKETGVEIERPTIAAVFINRLRLGMRLQTDPTVIYGMGARYQGNLRRQDLLTDTPFNTYTRAGLPPTPIALPGLASIEAALHPANSKALYFVANGQGRHVFNTTLAAHNQAVRQYQLKQSTHDAQH